MNYEFMIDISYSEYMVYRRKIRWLEKWEGMKSFKTHDEAKDYLNLIRDFPEYYK